MSKIPITGPTGGYISLISHGFASRGVVVEPLGPILCLFLAYKTTIRTLEWMSWKPTVA